MEVFRVGYILIGDKAHKEAKVCAAMLDLTLSKFVEQAIDDKSKWMKEVKK